MVDSCQWLVKPGFCSPLSTLHCPLFRKGPAHGGGAQHAAAPDQAAALGHHPGDLHLHLPARPGVRSAGSPAASPPAALPGADGAVQYDLQPGRCLLADAGRRVVPPAGALRPYPAGAGGGVYSVAPQPRPRTGRHGVLHPPPRGRAVPRNDRHHRVPGGDRVRPTGLVRRPRHLHHPAAARRHFRTVLRRLRRRLRHRPSHRRPPARRSPGGCDSTPA